MEKVRDLIKNERHEEYLELLKNKVNEIVEFLGLLPVEPPVDEDGD